MKTFSFSLLLTVALVPLLYTATAIAGQEQLPASFSDGWHRWQVASVESAPSWCCSRLDGGTANASVCQLDGQHNYLHTDTYTQVDDSIAIYARVVSNEIKSVRAFAASCPVQARSSITEHGKIDADESVVRLARIVTPRSDVSQEALAAIALHDGREARSILLGTARSDSIIANRKDAIFWIGQTRAEALSGPLRQFMFKDSNAAIREHSAFVWSQTSLPDRAADLIKLGRTDQDADVRGKAWFWLAQTGDPAAREAIMTAVRTDQNRDVREDAIFALSQLAEDLGVDALIELLADQALHRDDRKRVLFWLAQSESPRALAYLSAVFDR